MSSTRLKARWLARPLALTAAAALAWPTSQLAAQAPVAEPLPPSAPGARVVTLTPRPGYFTEPSIAVDPRNPEHVVAAYQDNAHAAVSEDGGRTWTIARGTAPPDYRVSGDVSVVIDGDGRAFLSYIAFDRLGVRDYWAKGATRNGIYVRRSPDGGRTWDSSDVPVISWPTRPGIAFEDKPYLAVDATHGPHRGNLYIGWTEFTLDSTIMLFSRSTDHGASWSHPLRISTRAGLPRDDNGAVEGFDGAIGPDGTVYAVWCDGASVVFTRSDDGGVSFEPSRRVVATGPSYFNPAYVERANGFPQIAVDPRTGRLLVSWSDYTNGDVDVFVAASADGGRTWSHPVRVNDDPVHDGADQFFQWLAVDPADGASYVVFYDRRADAHNRDATVTLARSVDGGRHFTNYALSRTPFDPSGAFMGDYTGLAALDGRVYAIWTEQTLDSNQAGDNVEPRRRPHTIIRVGSAVFRTPGRAPARPGSK